MKHAWLLFFFVFPPLLMFGNFVENKPTSYTQPDGTVIKAFVSGDEYYHRVHDAEGYTILLHPDTGFAVYAIPDGNTIKASDYVVDKVNPAALGISPDLFPDMGEIQNRFTEQQLLRTRGSRADPIGTVENIIAFVRFHDQAEYSHTSTYSDYDDIFNSTTSQSLGDLYDTMSNGQLTINSHLYPGADGSGFIVSVQVSHDRAYYSPYNATTNPVGYQNVSQKNSRHSALIGELCGLVDPLVPAALDVDNDNDNVMDAFTFIVRGGVDDWGDLLWPTHYSWGGSLGTINGIGVTHYVLDFEGGLGPSVVSHEMGHMLGAPDYYHYSNAFMGSRQPWRSIRPVSNWDLMGSDVAQFWSAYTKWKYGTWFATIPTITPTSTPTTYTLTAIDQSQYSCYKIASSNPNQFYVLEYRRKTGRYDIGIPNTGLLIYRVVTSVNGTTLNGNSQGPPDELYLYRPGGDVDSNGDTNNAYFSAQSGRTAIHNFTDPKPWVFADTLTTPDGNLVITDIGDSGGTTISFVVRNSIPRTWVGGVSTNWATAANWQGAVLPTSSDDVIIPTGCVRYPHVISTANCRSLTMKAGTSITIEGADLIVAGNINTAGQIAMNNVAGNLYVTGSVFWESGSSSMITANAEIYVSGSMDFEVGSAVQMGYGYLEFNGAATSYIRGYEVFQINNLRVNKASATLYYSVASEQDLYLNGSFWNYNTSTFIFNDTHSMYVKGNFTNYSGGHTTFTFGSIRFIGENNQVVTDNDAASYFQDFVIDTSNWAVVSIASSIRLHGDFSLWNGTFQTNNNSITLWGDWTNNVSPIEFYEGTGTVYFSGTSDQVCNGEIFYNLVLDKAAGELVIPYTSQTSCTNYDWVQGAYRVDGGWFVASNLTDNGIFGDITLNSGNIEYTQGNSDYVDIRGNITIHGGEFRILGGATPCYFTYLDASSLTMDGGILDFVNVGIRISDAWAFTEDITGGTIRTSLGLDITRTDFTPAGGTFELYGTANCNLMMTAGSNLYNLTINKAARENRISSQAEEAVYDRNGRAQSLTRNYAVLATGPLDLNGSFSLNAGTFTAPPIMQVAGNWTNLMGSAAFIEGTGSVEFNGSSHQYCYQDETFYTLIINKVAALRMTNNADVSCSNYTWTAGAVDVLSGSFSADDLTQNGIYGNFYANSGCTINLRQDSANWIDLNGYLYNYGGTINIVGGNMDCYWAYSANGGVTMTGGVIDFQDHGVVMQDYGHTLTTAITGGTLKTTGNFSSNIPNIHFTAGTVELYGANNVALSLGVGSYINDLTINKAIARDNQLSRSGSIRQVPAHDGYVTLDERYEGVYVNSNLLIRGNLSVNQGIFNVNGNTVETYNNIDVHSQIQMTEYGYLICGDDFIWYSGSSSNITNGSISCRWDWRFDSGSTVQLTGTTTTLNPDYDANITSASPNSWFGSLIINGNGGGEGSTVYIAAGSTSPLVVNGTLTVYAENLLNMAEHDLTVSNTVTINAGGGISVGDGGTLTMQGAFANSGSLNIGAGTATVAGTYSSTDSAALLIVGGTFVNSVAWTRDADFAPVGTASTSRAIVDMRGAIHLEGGLLEITNNTVVMRAHADRVFSSGIMRVGVGFTAVEAGSFPQTSGTLELVGANNSVLEVSGGNTVYNLTIEKGGSYNAYLQSNLIVNGNLTLLSGGIVANSYTISLGGNWANSSGALAFNPGTGTVIFGKSGGTQTVTGSTGFYNLTENHTGTLLQFNSTVSINNILELTNGANFLAAATIATLNNNPAASEVKFNGSYTSTINSYNSGGILRALTLAHVDILDITDNGIYGSYEANSGTLELHQDAAQWIDINGFITVTNNGRFDVYGGSLDAYFTYATNSGITMDSGQINFWNKGIMIYNSAYTFSCNITGGVIRTAAGFWNYRANFTPGGGSVEFIGSLDGQISMAAGSYFKDLIINKPSALRDETEQLPEFSIAHDGSPIPLTRSQTASLSSAIEVRGNLTIQAGILASNSNNISLYGYWTNDVGAAAFTEGTGYVRFIGSNTLTGINSSDTFYNLALVNTSASYNNVKIAANKTVTVLNNLVIQDGTLNMQNSSSLSVGNDILISSGAGLNANNATGVNISVIRHFSDANASYNDTQGFYPGTSTLTFTGAGISSVSTTETSFDTGNLTISKGAGGEVHFSKPVKVSGNCSLSSGLWADDANGFTHEFRGNLSIGASGSFYTTNQNTLAFKGGIAQTLTNSGAGVIYGLTVDKTAGTALNLGSNILGLNGGSVLVNAGILNLGSYFYRSTGNLTVNNTGKISVGADGSLEVANTKSLTVNTGGILELLGSAGHNARLTHQSGYYGLNLETGATLSAEYATFEYMDGFGVNIKSGALVDATHSLHNCTFQLGAVSGTLLTVNNTQIFSVNNANFPTNTWSGTYNVAKTLSQGSITFNSVSGNFAGAAYENDAFSRINWPAAALPELEITSASVNYTTRYVCDVITYSISIRNNSAYAINTPFNVALYYHSAGVPGSTVTPDQTHTFASLAAGATASWTFSTTSSTVVTTWNSYFRVDAGNTVAESNETNNTLGGFTINWQALPAVTAPTITYNEPTNQVVLHWTYPTTVSNYKVFRSTNPEGPFTSVIATPSTNTYSEAATGTKYFYRITAVKNWP